MYKTAANRRGDADGWVDEEMLDDMTMDVDEGNMDFSNAYVDTEVDHIHAEVRPGLAEVPDAEAEVESHVSGNTSEDDNMRNVLSRNVKRYRRIVTTAISALLFKINTFDKIGEG
jgi:hypothetical protein